MDFNKPYFTTSTINGWKHLLKSDKYKDIITGSLKYLSDKKLIKVYAFAPKLRGAQSYPICLGIIKNE